MKCQKEDTKVIEVVIMAKKTEEEKILFNPYISLSTIQRYFSIDKVSASDIFVKAQESDEKNGYICIYDDRVRKEAVLEILGISLDSLLKSYQVKKGVSYD